MLYSSQVSSKVLNGSEILLKCLENEGVKYIFGIPGGVILPIYDALYKNENIVHILTKHEQAAVHAAEGYARSTGKVGVALATSGPGATNTLTGITDAYYDSVPIVVFTGNVSTSMLGNDAFQESDIVGMTRACTKHNYIVRNINDLADTVKEAFYVASTGRPGPVLVDLPKDVLIDTCEYKYSESINLAGYNPYPDTSMEVIQEIFSELDKSTKPLILCGGGVVSSDSSEELLGFSEKFDIPVASTLMGLGGFKGSHRNFLGFSGMHGNYWANLALAECDLLLIFGSRLSDRQTGIVDKYCPNARIIQIDIDTTSLNKNLQADITIQADIQHILKQILDIYKDFELSEHQKNMRSKWWRQIFDTKEEFKTLQLSVEKPKLSATEVIEKVYNLSDNDAFVTTEVGQHQMWAAQCFNKDNPRSFISSGGLGTMGFGFPAALGVQVANPDKQVIVIAGDGSIQMNIQELATAVSYGLPVKVVIINNGYLGMVRQWQGFMFNRYSEAEVFSPDYVCLAKSYGAGSFRIENRDDLDTILAEALSYPGPALIDCKVENEEDVYPWVPVGKANREMLLES